MAPETGAMISKKAMAAAGVDGAGARRAKPLCPCSEAEMWEVAIADGNTAAFGQQAVDDGKQAAKQAAGGYKADRSNPGHLGSLS